MKGDRKYARKTKVIEKEIIQELKEISICSKLLRLAWSKRLKVE